MKAKPINYRMGNAQTYENTSADFNMIMANKSIDRLNMSDGRHGGTPVPLIPNYTTRG